MTDETATNPVADDAPRVDPAAGVAPEANAPADDIDTEAFDRMPAPDEDADPDADPGAGDVDPEDKPAPGEADEIEVEVGGQKLRVPKAVEPLLLMQSDYTKKTQALAEQTRQVGEQAATLDAQRAQQVESLKAFRDEHMAVAQGEQTLANIAAELSEYGKITQAQWVDLQRTDPSSYDAARQRFELLRLTRSTTEEALSAAKNDLSTKEAKLSDEQKRSRAANLNADWGKSHEVLAKEVKDWTPQRFSETAKFAAERYGYTKAELETAPDPRAWRMAVDLMDAQAEIAKLKTGLKQQTTAAHNDKANAVKPAVQPRGNAQPRGTNDSIGTDEWMRRRTAQVARKGA